MSDIKGTMAVPSHYERKYTPALVISVLGLNFHEGNAIKYLSRWNKKNGIEDLKKALHYIEMIRDGYQRPRSDDHDAIQEHYDLSLRVRADSTLADADSIGDVLQELNYRVRFGAAKGHQSYQTDAIENTRFEFSGDVDTYRDSYGRIGDFAVKLLEIEEGLLGTVASGIIGLSQMLKAGHYYLPFAFPEINSDDDFDRAHVLFTAYNVLAIILDIEIDRLIRAQSLERSDG